MLKTIGKKFNRALHFDFHTPPGVKNIFGNFDAEKFADQLKSTHVEYVNITSVDDPTEDDEDETERMDTQQCF